MTTMTPDTQNTREICETFGCPNAAERFYQLALGSDGWLCSRCIKLADDVDVGKYDHTSLPSSRVEVGVTVALSLATLVLVTMR